MDPIEDLPGQLPADPPTTPVVTGSPTLTPEAIRKTPEYQALERQNRALARQAGTANANERKARELAEQTRLEAQAREDASLQDEITSLLGDDGLAAWDEFAQLSQTDPRAAARKWAELTGRLDAARTATDDEGDPMAQPTPAQPAQQQPGQPRTLGADAPLTSIAAPDLDEQVIADRERTYGELVERNQREPNRVSEKERGTGMMAFLEVSYRKARRAVSGG